MKLSDILSTLTTANVTVVVKDLTSGAEIVSMKASGYANLDDTLENRTVAQWQIASATQIVILLNEAG